MWICIYNNIFEKLKNATGISNLIQDQQDKGPTPILPTKSVKQSKLEWTDVNFVKALINQRYSASAGYCLRLKILLADGLILIPFIVWMGMNFHYNVS